MNKNIFLLSFFICFECFSQASVQDQDLSSDCALKNSWNTDGCATLLDKLCNSEIDIDILSCISTINTFKIEDKYKKVGPYIKKLRGSEDECIKYSDAIHFEDVFFSLVELKIDYKDYEVGANFGYLNPMEVLAKHSQYYNESLDNRKKSLYWSLVYHYRLNQKIPSYYEFRKIREKLYDQMTANDVGEVVEKFLDNIKRIDFKSCS